MGGGLANGKRDAHPTNCQAGLPRVSGQQEEAEFLIGIVD